MYIACLHPQHYGVLVGSNDMLLKSSQSNINRSICVIDGRGQRLSLVAFCYLLVSESRWTPERPLYRTVRTVHADWRLEGVIEQLNDNLVISDRFRVGPACYSTHSGWPASAAKFTEANQYIRSGLAWKEHLFSR